MGLTPQQHTWAKRFHWISLIEGISTLVLFFIAMPLKYMFEYPLAVTYVGSAHGALFILYILTVFPTARKLKWNFNRTLFAIAASIIPFGPFIFHINLKKSQRVEL